MYFILLDPKRERERERERERGQHHGVTIMAIVGGYVPSKMHVGVREAAAVRKRFARTISLLPLISLPHGM